MHSQLREIYVQRSHYNFCHRHYYHHHYRCDFINYHYNYQYVGTHHMVTLVREDVI